MCVNLRTFKLFTHSWLNCHAKNRELYIFVNPFSVKLPLIEPKQTKKNKFNQQFVQIHSALTFLVTFSDFRHEQSEIVNVHKNHHALLDAFMRIRN